MIRASLGLEEVVELLASGHRVMKTSRTRNSMALCPVSYTAQLRVQLKGRSVFVMVGLLSRVQ